MYFNYFDLSSVTDFQYLLDSIGQDVLVNNYTIKALITNTEVEQYFDDKYISTLTAIKRGDMINYDNINWLILSEVNGKRINKYKGIMRRCNYVVDLPIGSESVITGYDGLGRPIYETVTIDIPVDCIVENENLSVTSTGSLNLPSGKINLTIQENENTNQVTISQTFDLMGINWTITGIDKTQVGLLILQCEKTA